MADIVAPTNAQLDALVTPFLANQPAGLAFVIGYASPQIPGNAGIYLQGGLADQYGRPLALDGNALFEIASVSKTFTATLYAYQLGKYINQDPTLGDFFEDAPRFRIGRQFYDIKIADLLNYTSGLPQDNDKPFGPPFWPRPYTVPGMCGFLEMTGDQPVGSGTAYTYSNLGFALASVAAQRMADEPDTSFVELMRRHVFGPLGMTASTYFGRTDLARLPLGYACSNAGECLPTPPGNAVFPAYNGAGGVVTTPRDLMTWLQFNMGMLANDTLSPLLPRLQRPATTVTTGGGAQLGLSWFLTPSSAPAGLIWKDGEIAGCNSYMLFQQSAAPGSIASQAGVFVLTNASGMLSGSAEVVAALAHQVLALMQGGPAPAEPPAWSRMVGRLPGL